MNEQVLDKIIDYLWASKDKFYDPQVYVILDAARNDTIYPKLLDSEEMYINLYRGEKAKELETVAPYLVKLEQDSEFTDWVIQEGWDDNWGIFFESQDKMIDIRKHFRSLLMVIDEEGTPFYFRYYDPRGLRVYLPTCNKNELETVYGPVSHYFTAGEEELNINEYALVDGQLMEKKEEVS